MTPIVAAAARRVEAKALRSLRGFRLDAADAEDIVQEAFASVLRAKPDLRTADQLEAWVMTAARNKAINNVRAKAATTRSAAPPPERADRGSPEDVLDRAGWTRAFMSLSTGDQRALVAALDSGPDGLAPAARKRLQRARERLEARVAGLAACLVRVRDRLGGLDQAGAGLAAAAALAVAAQFGPPGTVQVRSDAPPVAASRLAGTLPAAARRPAGPSATVAAGTPRPPRAALQARPAGLPPQHRAPVVLAVETPRGPVEWTNGEEDDHGKAACVANALVDECVYWPDAGGLVGPGE